MENGAFTLREMTVSFVYSTGKCTESCYQSRKKKKNNLICRTVLILACLRQHFSASAPRCCQREHHSLCEQMGRLSHRGEL